MLPVAAVDTRSTLAANAVYTYKCMPFFSGVNVVIHLHSQTVQVPPPRHRQAHHQSVVLSSLKKNNLKKDL